MRLYPCHVVSVHPITHAETLVGEYDSRMDCARAIGCSSAAVSTAIYSGYLTRQGCYIRDGYFPKKQPEPPMPGQIDIEEVIAHGGSQAD